jgi:flagellar protein FliO/FliZ
MWRWIPLCMLYSGTLLAAETAQKGVGVKSPPLGTESLLQTSGGLLLILFLIIGGAWLFKRYGSLPLGSKGVVRVVGGVSVGPRERVVVVEAEGRRLLLGVAPGQVRTLCELSGVGDFDQALSQARDTAETDPAEEPRP